MNRNLMLTWRLRKRLSPSRVKTLVKAKPLKRQERAKHLREKLPPSKKARASQEW